MSRKEMVVGLDIGTTKICAVVGEITEDGRLEIVGIGKSVSSGLKKGIVVDIEKTVDSIERAIDEAERMAGCNIGSVYVGIAGSHIKGRTNKGVIAIKSHEVEKSDIERVIEGAKSIHIPPEEQVLHVLPQDFIVDGQNGIKNPLGISGDRLEVEVYIVTAANTSVRNIINCVEKAGLDVLDIILQPLASSEAVLTKEEKSLGVTMVDIGGGTTDVAIFMDNSVWHTSVIAVGGNHVTNDIAIGLRTPFYEAEKIKIEHGTVSSFAGDEQQDLEVPSVGGRNPRMVPRQLLRDIIEPRIEEIISLVWREIKKTGNDELAASGVVLTGGTSLVTGIDDIAERILDLPVRIGMPHTLTGMDDIVKSPIYATGVGLIQYAMKERKTVGVRNGRFFSKFKTSVENWFKEYF